MKYTLGCLYKTVGRHLIECRKVDRSRVEPGSSTPLLAMKTEDRRTEERSSLKTEDVEEQCEEDLLR